MPEYLSYPYVVCPKSGNQYTLHSCNGVSLCSCGCNKNLKDLLDEQVENGNLRQVTVWVNTTEVQRARTERW